MAALSFDGERTSGEDVRSQNVAACTAIANVIKSSLGPVGLDKMLVSEIGDVTVSNDGATILGQLEVQHPAGKVLVELAQQQDEEVGDGTTSVVLLAAELLRRGNELVKAGIHPTSIIAGYRLAMREASKYVRDSCAVSVERLGRDCLVNAAKTSLSSKILGGEVADLFGNIAVDAVQAIRTKREDGSGAYTYPIKTLNIIKSQGKSVRESRLLSGYGLNMTRASRAMPERVTDARIACLDVDLRRAKLQMGMQMLVNEPNELNKMQEKEMDITRDRIRTILKSGANVVFTTKGIDDAALKHFTDAGAVAVRRVSKADLKRIARSTGATVQVSLVDLSGDEVLDASALGHAEEVVEEHVADSAFTFIRGCKLTKAATILLRGPNEFMIDEMERSMHDALSVVKRALESNAVVPGGGAVEAALSIFLENFATTLGTREQLAIAEFAEALLVIPKTLAVNAAQDATDLVAKLRAVHSASQSHGAGTSDGDGSGGGGSDSSGSGRDGDAHADGGGGGGARLNGAGDEAGGAAARSTAVGTSGGAGASNAAKRERYAHIGLDLVNGQLRDNYAAGVFEPAVCKIKSIQFAAEGAITILRIDDSIKLREAQQPEDPES